MIRVFPWRSSDGTVPGEEAGAGLAGSCSPEAQSQAPRGDSRCGRAVLPALRCSWHWAREGGMGMAGASAAPSSWLQGRCGWSGSAPRQVLFRFHLFKCCKHVSVCAHSLAQLDGARFSSSPGIQHTVTWVPVQRVPSTSPVPGLRAAARLGGRGAARRALG